MRLVGALGRSEIPVADEQTDGLTALNAMLAEWWTNNLAVYRYAEKSFTWSAGNASRTIGATGDVVNNRPNEIGYAYQTLNGTDYPIHRISAVEYFAIPDKSTTGTLITRLYYDASNPSGTLYAYPVPASNATVVIKYLDELQTFDSATEEIALPPGYENAIVYNLAVDLADEYQRPLPATVARRAAMSLNTVRRQNSRPVFMRAAFGGERFSITRGY